MNRNNYKFLLGIFLLLANYNLIAQPTQIEGTWVDGGAFNGNIGTLTDRGTQRFFRTQASGTTGTRTVLFNNPSDNYNPKWVADNTTALSKNTFLSSGAKYYTGGGTDIHVAITSGSYYTFVIGENSGSSNNLSILETSYAPRSITSVSQSPLSAAVYNGQSVTVTATLSGTLQTDEYVYLRYTTNNWSSSTAIQMVFSSGTSYASTIAGQVSGTNVEYYVFTSNQSSVTANHDYFSLNIRNATGENLNGANYTYSPSQNWSTVAASAWSSPSTWNAGIAPPTDINLGNVTMNHDVTMDQNAIVANLTVSSSTTTTVPSSNTLDLRGTATLTGALTVNGTLKLTGSSASVSAAPSYNSASSTLIYDRQTNTTIGNEWPTSNGPRNITITGGSTYTMGADRSLNGNFTITNGDFRTSGTRTLTMNGSTQTLTISNTSGGSVTGTDASAGNDLILTIQNGSTLTLTGDVTSNNDNEKKFFDVNVNSGGTLILARGILCRYGTFTVAGTLRIDANGYVQSGVASSRAVTYSSGTLNYNSGGAYTSTNAEWPSSSGPTNVIISNTSTNLNLHAARTITGSLTVSTGATLTTGGNLTLSSSGRIANSNGGAFSGNVNIQIATTATRAFRFFGHPFTTSIAMSQFTGTGEIDITGNSTGAATSGTPCTGCTSTTNNSPSAFSYNPSTGNPATNPTDPGWESFNDLSTSTWDRYEGVRVLVRGAKGEGLTGAVYTPTATTITLTGAVNDGASREITLSNGSNSDYNLIGNPFCSAFDLGQLPSGQRTNLGSNFRTWSPTGGSNGRGQYVATSFGSSYIIPVGGAFFLQKSTGTTLTITESDKTSSAAAALFKTDINAKDQISLNIQRDGQVWDNLKIRFRDNGSSDYDYWDAEKFNNPDFNFSSKSANNMSLAIDVRPIPASTDVIYTTMKNVPVGEMTFDFSESQLPSGMTVFLRDAYLGTEYQISTSSRLNFTVDSNEASMAENRFSFAFSKLTTSIAKLESEGSLILFPNPASNKLNIVLNKTLGCAASYSIIDQSGRIVITGEMEFGSRRKEVNVEMLKEGIYLFIMNSEQEGRQEVLRFVK